MQIINKQIDNIYRKALYKCGKAPINISYTRSNTWYDYTLSDIQDSLLNFLPYSNNIPINDHLYFINDPLYFSQIENRFAFYIPKVLFFHNASILSMKKEDRYLLNNKIKLYNKYTFIHELANTIPNINVIDYGFSEISSEALNRRHKSILFIAEEKNMDQIIFANIKQKYPDSDMIFLKPNNIGIDSLLLNYKVCINLSSGYNTLLAASRGCITVSAVPEKDIPHHYVANEMSQIIKCLEEATNLNSGHIINHNFITKKYPYSTYIQNIQNIIKDQLNKESIYE